jgi:oligo-1,6-glucosidase
MAENNGQGPWWKNAVVYQIYPKSFKDSNGDGIGDIPGIISRLDYLQDLGIDAIWLSPVYASPQADNGYDISDYQGIDPMFGTMADMDKLLAEARKRGIHIVMDLVVNHTSNEHPWFIESRKSKDNEKRDWYLWRDPYNGGEPNKLGAAFGGLAWEFDEQTGQYYLHLFAKEQPDLNWDNPKVRDAVFTMMNWWLDRGVDGFRMDVISLISKHPDALVPGGTPNFGHIVNGPHVHEYLKEMNRRALAGRDIMTVGEAAGVTLEEAKKYANADGSELNMVFHFDHMGLDSDQESGPWHFKQYKLADLKAVITKWEDGLYNTGWNSLYLSNHDQPRSVSRFGDTSTTEFWDKSAKMLATWMHMLQGTPYVYQGEELGMTNVAFKTLEEYNDLATLNAYRELVTEKKLLTHDQMMAGIWRGSRDNARTPVQWDTTANAGFSTAKPWLAVNPNYTNINAAKQIGDPASIFNYYKKLIKLRKTHPIIVHGKYELILKDDDRIYAYRRAYNGQTLLVLCNFTDQPIPTSSLGALPETAGTLLIGNYDAQDREQLKAYEARVYLK